MSTALAIASVTAVVQRLLQNGLGDEQIVSSVGEVKVSATPPDRIDVTIANPKSQLNLFLYQATPNQGWRNTAHPSRDAAGNRVGNPPLALDLHYLLSAYGAKDLDGEILLGYGMQTLHETPVLAREAIRKAFGLSPNGNGGPITPAALATSELADQVEQIKITPLPLTTEDISRLWTAFQARYRPTAAYLMSVVLIEARMSARSALPVRARNIYVVPFRHPVIEKLLSRSAVNAPIVEGQPIFTGHDLVIDGHDLRSDPLRVKIDRFTITPDPANVEDARIIVPLPPALPAGVRVVQVVHLQLMGTPPVPHGGMSSNVAAFVLRPQIQGLTVSPPQTTESGLLKATVTVRLLPAVGESQRVTLMLNEFNPPPTRDARGYSFSAPPRQLLSPPEESEFIDIPIAEVAPGTYVVRVQVDGAESPLQIDGSGRYSQPQFTIP